MANFWRDVARGIQPGFEMGRQAAKDARERQLWEEEQAYKRSLAEAGQGADVEARQGLQVTGNGQTFYVPNEDAARAYQDAGYTYDPAQRTYQELRAGSRTLGQTAGTEDPSLGGLQRTYNAGRSQRMMDAALQAGKFQDANAINQLEMAPLQRKAAELGIQASENQLALAPGQKRAQELNLAAAELKQGWADARSKGLPGMLQFYDSRISDGHKSQIVEGKDGTMHVYRVETDDSGKPVGKPKLWQSFRPQFGLSAEQMAAAVIDGHMGDDKTLLKIAEMNMNADLKKAQIANTAAMYSSRHGLVPLEGGYTFNPNTGAYTDVEGKRVTDPKAIEKIHKLGAGKDTPAALSPEEANIMAKIKKGDASPEDLNMLRGIQSERQITAMFAGLAEKDRNAAVVETLRTLPAMGAEAPETQSKILRKLGVSQQEELEARRYLTGRGRPLAATTGPAVGEPVSSGNRFLRPGGGTEEIPIGTVQQFLRGGLVGRGGVYGNQ